MNHSKIYNQIIERGKLRILESYTEKHHIIPKCMGGTNDNNNLVELTAREHFICHKLLTEIYPEQTGLRYATFRMTHSKMANGKKRNYIVGAREYQRLRLLISKIASDRAKLQKHSKEVRKKISESLKGHYVSNESRKKMSASATGKLVSEETRKKLSISSAGRIVSKSTRTKISIAGKGRVVTDETRNKISESLKGKSPTMETRKKLSEANKGNIPWNKGNVSPL